MRSEMRSTEAESCTPSQATPHGSHLAKLSFFVQDRTSLTPVEEYHSSVTFHTRDFAWCGLGRFCSAAGVPTGIFWQRSAGKNRRYDPLNVNSAWLCTALALIT